jgi:hypothetical protein
MFSFLACNSLILLGYGRRFVSMRCEYPTACRPASGALRHPKPADHGDYEGNVVKGGAHRLFTFRSGPHLSEQRTPGGVGTVEQDREQKPVFDPAEIAERLPGVVTEFHCGRNPMHQGLARTVPSSVRSRIGANSSGAVANPSLMALKRATIELIAATCSEPSMPSPLCPRPVTLLTLVTLRRPDRSRSKSVTCVCSVNASRTATRRVSHPCVCSVSASDRTAKAVGPIFTRRADRRDIGDSADT